MPEQMMRVAGRGTDGTAKALQTTNEGNIIIKENKTREVFSAIMLPVNQMVKSHRLESHGYLYGQLMLKLANPMNVKIYIIDFIPHHGDSVPRLVFNGFLGDQDLAIPYDITTEQYSIGIEVVGTVDGNLRPSYEVLTDSPMERKAPRQEIFGAELVEANTKKRSSLLYSHNYKYGSFHLRIAQSRDVKVYIVDHIIRGGEQEPRLIFDGRAEQVTIINYEITSDRFYIEVVPSATMSARHWSYNYLSDNPFREQTSLTTAENELKAIKTLVEKISSGRSSNEGKTTKFPKNKLSFKKSPLPIKVLSQSLDGYFYYLDTNDTIQKVSSVTEVVEPLEAGIKWDSSSYGELIRFYVLHDGVVYFTNYDNGSNKESRIYRSDNIKGTPEMVYQPSDPSIETVWTRNFGVDYMSTGVTDYFIAGQYGIGANERDLLLSKDGGKTFEVVKKTLNLDSTVNSHWHDAIFDEYHGLIWASQGDGNANKHVFYSSDFGRSWNTLSDKIQPTAIVPFPDKIVFGRDDQLVGLDAVNMPADYIDIDQEEVYSLKELKKSPAFRYYSLAPVVLGGEAYMNFHLYGESNTPLIIGTGDYGKTWHGLVFGGGQNEFNNFTGIDEEYVYIYGLSGIYYAKKPEWVE